MIDKSFFKCIERCLKNELNLVNSVCTWISTIMAWMDYRQIEFLTFHDSHTQLTSEKRKLVKFCSWSVEFRGQESWLRMASIKVEWNKYFTQEFTVKFYWAGEIVAWQRHGMVWYYHNDSMMIMHVLCCACLKVASYDLRRVEKYKNTT